MGKVYIVGAGPGSVDLITVKGLRCIQQADVILYDRLVNKELLEFAKPNAELIFVGKLPKLHGVIQDRIHRLLVEHAMQGKVVTRLKGGDPFVFGRGAEEAEILVEAGIPFEIVPGVTSGVAAPAYAGIPVTHRDYGSSFALVTGHMREGKDDTINWKGLAESIDTLAIYMGVGNLPYITGQLIKFKRNPSTPVALIHWGTTDNQRTITGTLETIVDIAKNENIQNPSMILVGEVVKMREKIAWFEETKGNFQEISV
ncbi:uroporphyrinogen-III C-methyltransferase [Ureibacillus sinduriensis]|uniref:Uroporphyrinogen-III C-methyltransferase n=1 Tax=Ureibacillus sinduriensis BLB-1 = JCM 15800 TaxID=1384057 RepID=A0A0A3I6W1_9BACL|nr:uroporphyrinogen-III C-methyltransferase [Ureibacillus sinduriensis]KGR78433.1 uroporphyrin-III methyltransferase [Ureibacillus sinduriensis BLB-1 = JCM 15800]